MIVFISKTLLIGNLGSVSGFIFHHYSPLDLEKKNDPNTNFAILYGAHLFIVGLFSLVLSSFLGKEYFFGAIGFMILIPFYVVEPLQRIKRKFISSLYPEIILSLSTIFTSLIIAYCKPNLFEKSSELLIIMILCITSAGLLIFQNKKKLAGIILKEKKNLSFCIYAKNIKTGFPLYSCTFAFLLLLSVDRIFLNRYHSPDTQANYFLAYQFALGSSLLLSAQNFISGIDIGEAYQQGRMSLNLFMKKIIFGALLAAFGFFAMIISIIFLNKFYFKSGSELIKSSAALGLGLSSFYISGNVSGFAFFKQRQIPLTIGLFIAVLVAIVYNIIIVKYQLPSIWISYFNGATLFTYAILAVLWCLKK